MTESYLAAAVNLHHECPRGFGASEHVLNYVHRQSPATGHILCMKGGAPRELKEIYVKITKAQCKFWECYDRDQAVKGKS